MAQAKRQPKKTGKNGKHPGGRPTKFRPEMSEQVTRLCDLGATEMEIADFFGVSVRTMQRWKLESEEFCRAVRIGKDACDERMVRSLYHRGIGGHVTEEQAIKVKVARDVEKVEVVKVERFIPPDTAAAFIWLKNRREHEWKDKRVVEGDHRHHHSAEPVSESSGWIAGMLGAAEDCEAEEPVQGGSLLPVEVRPERDTLRE